MGASYSRVPDSEDVPRDLQNRVGRLVLITLMVDSVMLIASVSADTMQSHFAAAFARPGRVVHVVSVVVLLGVWLGLRRKPLGLVALERLEAALTVFTCTAWAGLGWGARPEDPIEFSISLATTYTLITRSVVVPSTFARTLVIGTLAALPTILFIAVRGMPFVAGATPGRARAFVVFGALWALIAVVIAAVNSRTLFGLRKHIREARKLGQYTLEEKIGEGGMGAVYRASHAMLRRPAAIKLLLPGRTGEQAAARFEREVQLTSRLMHPNTISIFDYGRSAQGVFYYVMEYLDGFDLERLVREQGAIEPARVIHILAQVSAALSEAHALGLIHRDIKPANIILTERVDEPDVIKVVDFGLVRPVVSAPGDPELTQTDVITGTPMYLAPEAITSSEGVDARSDLYALGAVGYYLLTSQHVFEASSIVEMCSKHLLEVPVAPSQRVGRPLPIDLERVILGCLEKDRAHRPQSAAALRTALLGCTDAGAYDVDAMRAWWRTHGARLRQRSTQPPADARAATVAIDLSGRATMG